MPALSRAWPPGARIAMAACVVFALLMIAGQADLTVATITGAADADALPHFRGIHVVRSTSFRAAEGECRAHQGVSIFSPRWLMTRLIRRTGQTARRRPA
jgi:hypothetical protein